MLVAGGGSEERKSVALALSDHRTPASGRLLELQDADCPSCGGQCRNSGTVDAPITATSMAPALLSRGPYADYRKIQTSCAGA